MGQEKQMASVLELSKYCIESNIRLLSEFKKLSFTSPEFVKSFDEHIAQMQEAVSIIDGQLLIHLANTL